MQMQTDFLGVGFPHIQDLRYEFIPPKNSRTGARASFSFIGAFIHSMIIRNFCCLIDVHVGIFDGIKSTRRLVVLLMLNAYPERGKTVLSCFALRGPTVCNPCIYIDGISTLMSKRFRH